MGFSLLSQSPRIFLAARNKIIAIFSLVLIWWFALYILPPFQRLVPNVFDTTKWPTPVFETGVYDGANPSSAYNRSKVALIIEPRPIPHLVPQLLHMIQVAPPDWRFVFIGSNKSVISVGRSFATKHQQTIGKLDLVVLPEPWEVDSKEKVHRLMTDLRFYDEFLPGVEWILKFESDSILCANSGVSLNEWLGWSWAGAPKTSNDRFSGNGGLTLRRVSAIRRILSFQERHNDTEPEDEWFGKRLWVLPGEKVAARLGGVLAVEDVYIEEAMGYHVRNGGSSLPDSVWKDAKQRKKILDYCPEVSLIMDMKLERERCAGDNKDGTITVPKDSEPTPTDGSKGESKAGSISSPSCKLLYVLGIVFAIGPMAQNLL